MTILEALKGKLSYPLPDENAYLLALTNRALTHSDTYVIGNKKLLELAYADLICTLVTSPGITEGGFTISPTDKKTLIKLATGIYESYGEHGSLLNTATFVQRM